MRWSVSKSYLCTRAHASNNCADLRYSGNTLVTKSPAQELIGLNETLATASTKQLCRELSTASHQHQNAL
eukprot:9152-Heterococcus_DN1.PRE.5